MTGLSEEILNMLDGEEKNDALFTLGELFEDLSDICDTADKPIVLIIDEVDSATNNQVFLDFLGQLKGYYLTRDEIPTFQSVILAGVYDVKNIRRKIRSDEEHKVNSPWNTREGNESKGSWLPFDDCTWDHRELATYDIATEFKINMSFSQNEIAGMLSQYEADHQTGMDVNEMAGLIYDYTSGYPFLVSRLCKLLDEDVAGSSQEFMDESSTWTKAGFLEAVKILLSEKNSLFESLMEKISDYQGLRQVVYTILFSGEKFVYNPDEQWLDIAMMFGFVKNKGGSVEIANRIFEM